MRKLNTLLIFSITFLLPVLISAQWTNETAVNTLVTESEGGDMKAIATSDGSTFVVFWKTVPGPTNYELRLQRIDNQGVQQLGPDGILISNEIPMSTFTVIWSITLDQDDNILVGVTGTGNESGHVYKLDANGNHIWSPAGINVGTGYSLKMLPLDTYETIVSWLPNGPGLMQKYDENGIAVWPAPKPVESGSGSTVVADMFEQPFGTYLAVYHSLSFGISSTLYAQRYDGDGNTLWTGPLQISNGTTAFNREYGGVQDGDIVYYGYFSSTANRFDAYVQRINPDGVIPWGINGTDFDTNETDYEMDTRIAFESGSDFVWAICTYSNTSQGELGERVQKFDKETGNRFLTDNAKVVYPISADHNKHAGDLFLADDRPFFLTSNGFDNGATPTTLSVVLLDEIGEFFWFEDAFSVATFEASKSRVHLTEPSNGQATTVFIEDKGNGNKIYAQNFTDVELGGVGVDEITTNIEVSVYPNPTDGPLNILINTEAGTDVWLRVFNMTSKLISEEQVYLVPGENQIVIDTEKIQSGLYRFQLLGEDLKATGSFTKIK
ncbi:MAG: hypothetical protein ACI8XB_000906 [Patiriisocius sp.]|jgi:hypothetical protein